MLGAARKIFLKLVCCLHRKFFFFFLEIFHFFFSGGFAEWLMEIVGEVIFLQTTPWALLVIIAAFLVTEWASLSCGTQRFS